MEAKDSAALLRLEEALSAAAASRRRRLLANRWGSVALLLVFGGFLWSIYGTVRDRYALENFREPVRLETERLTPHVRDRLRAVALEAGPVYGKLAQERMEVVLPLLRDSLRREWEILSSNLATRAEPEVTGAVKRLEERQWARLVAHYPSLHEEANRLKLREEWKEAIDREHARIFADFDLKVGHDLEDLLAVIERFRPNPFETWDEEPLTRHFIHLWLTLLDRQVLGLDDPEAIAHDNLVIDPMPRGEVNDER